MIRNIILLLLIAIGGFMISVTSENLGEQGNIIMLLIGRILILGAIIAILFRIFKKKKR